MRIAVNITTYKRDKELKSLLNQLKPYDVDVFVWDDDPNGVEVDCFKYKKFNINHGKQKLWLKFKQIFKYLTKTNYDYYIFLPDDVELKDNFIQSVVTIWKSINDNNKICLSLLVDKRLNDQNWTCVMPRDLGNVYLTQWNDLCFFCEKKFIDEIEVKEVSVDRWKKNKDLGSGVGSQISWYLLKKGYNMYNVKDKLVQHLDIKSKMNYKERFNNPLL